MAANGGQLIVDPLDTSVSCFTAQANNTPDYCSYLYYTCDSGEGYALSAKFETTYNAQKYSQLSNDTSWYYNAGNCIALDLPPATSVPAPNSCRTKVDCVSDSVCVGPPPRHCRAKSSQTVGAECDENDDCQTGNCNTNAHKCKA